MIRGDDLAQILGSSRDESSVEPTRSLNITVSCRRSASTPTLTLPRKWGRVREGTAVGWRGGQTRTERCIAGVPGCRRRLDAKLGNRAEESAAIAYQGYAEVLQVLDGQAREDVSLDPVLAESGLVAL
jgi:hypothetical protein